MLKTTTFNILILTKNLAFFSSHFPKTTIIRAFFLLVNNFFVILGFRC